MSSFVLLPWEHAFSGANSKPHAQARWTVGGKTRNFVLKLRDGVLFFKEPARSAVFALPELLDEALSRDAIGLVSRWQREVAAGNFGVFVSKRDYFPQLAVRAHILLILKADGTGWMKEHFDDEWFLLPDEKRAEVDVWNDKDVDDQVRARWPFAARSLVSRTIAPELFERERPRFLAQSGERIAQIVDAAARLFIEPLPYWNNEERRLLKIRSHSAFAKGDIEGAWLKHALHNPRFARIWEGLAPEVQFVGVKWSEGGEEVADQYARGRSEKVFRSGLDKWGRYWRGNWAPQRATFRIALPDTTNQSAHEKMEAGLVVREWLGGKMSERDIEQLFSSA